MPDGVISLVHGGPATGEALVGSAIDGVAFTGSAEVGREIGRRLSEGPYPRPVLAEMGGKNAAIVGASADLEAAAEGIAKAAFGFSGQKCSACSRAIVVDEAHDELVRAARRASPATYCVGDPADPDAATGPVVNEQAVERFERSVEAARRDGAVAAGGYAGRRRRLVRRADGRLRLAAWASADPRRALPARSSPSSASPTSTPRSRRRTPSRTASRRASSRATTKSSTASSTRSRPASSTSTAGPERRPARGPASSPSAAGSRAA